MLLSKIRPQPMTPHINFPRYPTPRKFVYRFCWFCIRKDRSEINGRILVPTAASEPCTIAPVVDAEQRSQQSLSRTPSRTRSGKSQRQQEEKEVTPNPEILLLRGMRRC